MESVARPSLFALLTIYDLCLPFSNFELLLICILRHSSHETASHMQVCLQHTSPAARPARYAFLFLIRFHLHLQPLPRNVPRREHSPEWKIQASRIPLIHYLRNQPAFLCLDLPRSGFVFWAQFNHIRSQKTKPFSSPLPKPPTLVDLVDFLFDP